MDSKMEMMINYDGMDRLHRVLEFGGWASDRTKNKFSWKKIFLCYGAFNMLTTFVEIGFIIKESSEKLKEADYEPFFGRLSEINAAFFSVSAIILFIFCTRKFRQLMDAFKELAKYSLRYSPEEFKSNYPPSWKLSHILVFLHLMHVFGTGTAWFIVPIVETLFAFPHFAYEDIHLLLPYASFFLDRRKHIWLIYALQIMVTFGVVMPGIALVEMVVPIPCVLLRGQINILKQSLDKITNSPPSKKLLTEDTVSYCHSTLPVDTTGLDTAPGPNLGVDTMLRNCIKHHQMILRVMALMRKILGRFVFLSLLWSAVFFTNSAVAASMAETNKAKAIFTLGAVSVTILPFYKAWHLTTLQEDCARVSLTVLSLLLRIPSVRKDCLMMVIRSTRVDGFPCVLSQQFTLRTIYKILDMSWSYFTLCRAMKKKSLK